MESTLYVEDLRVTKAGRDLIENITLEFKTGELSAIVGPTGCGKSTLIRAIVGLEPVAAGRVLIDDRDLSPFDSYQRKSVVAVLQEPGVFSGLTTRENLTLVLKSSKRTGHEQDGVLEAVLDFTQLTRLADSKVDSFSGGEKARVAIARALLLDAPFLFIDEALSAVDAPLRRRLLRDLRSGLTINPLSPLFRQQQENKQALVFITHDQLDAFMFADKLIVMEGGRVLAHGTPEEIYRCPRSRNVGEFLGLATVVKGEIVRGSHKSESKRLVFLPELGVHASLDFEAAKESNGNVELIIRPEDIYLRPMGISFRESDCEVEVVETLFAGSFSYLQLKVCSTEFSLIGVNSLNREVVLGERLILSLSDAVALV